MHVGINSYFEHPSIAIVEESKLLFAAEDERFTGLKGGKTYNPFYSYMPFAALFHGLSELGRKADDISDFGFSYSPRKHLLSLGGCFSGARLSRFSEEIAAFFAALGVKKLLKSSYGYRPGYSTVMSPGVLGQRPFSYFDHHLCHAASAFYLSGFDSGLIVTADGAGERSAARVSMGEGATIRTLVDHNLPNSLGHLYSFVTSHLGFQPFSDEYKVMGLAGYGSDSFDHEFRRIITLGRNGRFSVNIELAKDLSQLLGPRRFCHDEILTRHKDIACSLQRSLERVLLHICADARVRFRSENACFAGGVFMNSVANGVIERSGIFEKTFFMPAATDAGTAIGAACLLNARAHPNAPQVVFPGMFLGTAHNDSEVETILCDFPDFSIDKLDDAQLSSAAATLLAQGQIGAIFRGRMEFGDRALGNRSILADPGRPRIVEILNSVKGREMFRPVAPVTLASAANDYFVGRGNEYMMTTCRVRAEKKEIIQGCVHVDDTARLQVIPDNPNDFLAAVLSAFGGQTGYPVLVNTSFNLHGQPMIEHPRQALVALSISALSFLVINNFLVQKRQRNVDGNFISPSHSVMQHPHAA